MQILESSSLSTPTNAIFISPDGGSGIRVPPWRDSRKEVSINLGDMAELVYALVLGTSRLVL